MAPTGLPTYNHMVAEATALETWRAINYSLLCAELLEFTSADLPARAAKRQDLKVQRLANNQRERFLFKASRLWNWIPEELREIKEVNRTKKLFKKYMKELSFH